MKDEVGLKYMKMIHLLRDLTTIQKIENREIPENSRKSCKFLEN
jgi:hypothetical protein